MPLILDTTHEATADAANANCVTVGLINNMPDAALEQTERQFIGLLKAAAGERRIRVKLFYVPEIARAGAARERVQLQYAPIEELWDSRLDGLIVTGNEPRTPDLRAEPYWRTLAKIVDWAETNTRSTIWSCLAAHAAVLHTDGITRHPLADKCFGVFDCVRSAEAVHDVDSRHHLLPERFLKCLPSWRPDTRRAEFYGVVESGGGSRQFHVCVGSGDPEVAFTRRDCFVHQDREI